ncbi:glycosyltransferase family A protein [Roseovarius sp. MMSF_3281]|uniref:glycosyltransferase family A protein n=1 Tax=Roseovarius sp. MMSF_3281 TaxID=3046694 RepID=UPI00273FDB44|nr:glycosyltransferase family A protein [Roseovarius sp. MMSF_3281]
MILLTPTGARPEAFAACVNQMRSQDYQGPVQWIIVDDGPEAMPTPEIEGWEIVHIRPEPLWQPGQNTQARNILAGLPYCTDRVAIIEDDDAYAPDWLATCDEWLNDADLVGESHSLYRHLNGTERECNNAKHASLCSTAMKGEGVAALAKACRSGEKFIDIRLWATKGIAKALYRPEPRRVAGIKGYPGRPGIGMGHRLK